MYFDDATTELLTKWLAKKLEPICEADPNVLAKYVIALLKHDKDAELKSHCVSQLTDFLKEETESFVTSMLQAIEDGSYTRDEEEDEYRGRLMDAEADEDEDEDRNNYRNRWPRNRDEDDENDDAEDEYHRRYRGSRRKDRDDMNGIDSKRRKYDSNNNNNHESTNIENESANTNSGIRSNDGNGVNRYDKASSDSRRNEYNNNNNRSSQHQGRIWDDRSNNNMNNSNSNNFNNTRQNNNFSNRSGRMPYNNMMGGYPRGLPPSVPQDMYVMYGGGGGGSPGMYGGVGMGMGYGMGLNGREMQGPPSYNYGPAPLPPYRMPMRTDHMGFPAAGGLQSNIGNLLPRTADALRGVAGPTPPLPPTSKPADATSSTITTSNPPLPDGQPPAAASVPPVSSTAESNLNAYGGFGYGSGMLDQGGGGMMGMSMGMGLGLRGFEGGDMSSEECHTIRCTGIPIHVTEKDLWNHFNTFGNIVEMKMVVVSHPIAGSGVKAYNECLIQFYEAQDCKKCFNSPTPVLNNRFIKLSYNRMNIIPLSMVPPVPLLSKTYDGGASFEGDGSKGNKPILDPEAAQRGRAEREQQSQAILQQFDTIRTLRQEAETLFKKREKILVDQIDQYKTMLSKLTNQTSAKALSMVETVETKLMDLQSQLQSLRDQHARGVASSAGGQVGGAGTTPDGSSDVYEGAGRGGRGRFARGGRGRFAATRGRGRGGSGRGRVWGRGHGRVMNPSIDNRSKTLLVQQPPHDFIDVAESHFSRFGAIQRVELQGDNVLVEFASRKTAELAKTQGANYSGQLLTMAWHHENPANEQQVSSEHDGSKAEAHVGDDGNQENITGHSSEHPRSMSREVDNYNEEVDYEENE